jgi:uncharacterized membrane protein (UPF0182 family)
MKKVLLRVFITLVIIFVIISVLSSFLIDFQWFKELNYINVFFTSIKAKLILFIPLLVLLFWLTYFYSLYLKKNYYALSDYAYEKNRSRKVNKIIASISLVISFVVSLGFTDSFWYKILQFLNASNFNYKDPVFGLDAGFYVFKLPLIEALIGVLLSIIIILLIVTFIYYVIVRTKEGISNIRSITEIKDDAIVKFVGKQLAILGALLLILLSGVFYTKALSLVYSPRGVAFGASYTDVHVTLPLYRVISVLCIVSAFIIAFSILKKKVKWIIYTASFIVVLMILEAAVSGLVEQFIVSPNAREKEMPYLTYNIKATRYAYGLDKIKEFNFPASDDLTAKDIEDNKGTVDNIRITEFSQELDVYNQIQAIRNYYKFNDVDIDRYIIDGKLRQAYVAARELDNSNREDKFQTWQNKHLFYTHGYGAVMSYTNTVNSSGLPNFIIKDIPAASNAGIKLDTPQIYFGELNDDYVIVGAKNNEIDYPAGNENVESRYKGTAGIKLNSFNRLLFAINEGSLNFLLSNDISSNSKILINRNVVDRVKRIAPFINYDKDPYLVVSNGKLYWIIDAYTTTDKFPFSEPYNDVNYIRNSIKVVVDAYNGNVDFYLTDKTDAIANTIGKIYKGLFKDINEMPSDLRSHLRYSEDTLKLQANVYEKYHMNNPLVFYNSEDLWSVAQYKSENGDSADVQPVYQVMKLPGENKEELILTLPFTVAKKENMVSWLAVRMGENTLGDMVSAKFPKDRSIYGPQQFNSKLNTDTYISSQLTWWGQQGSKIILGETNIIPIKDSLIYVKPLYLVASSGNSLPELKKVIVGYDDKIVMEDSIKEAFNKLFNTDESEAAVQNQSSQITTPVTGNENETSQQLINQAVDLYNKAKQSQQQGDWASYGNYLKQLGDTLSKMQSTSK